MRGGRTAKPMPRALKMLTFSQCEHVMRAVEAHPRCPPVLVRARMQFGLDSIKSYGIASEGAIGSSSACSTHIAAVRHLQGTTKSNAAGRLTVPVCRTMVFSPKGSSPSCTNQRSKRPHWANLRNHVHV